MESPKPVPLPDFACVIACHKRFEHMVAYGFGNSRAVIRYGDHRLAFSAFAGQSNGNAARIMHACIVDQVAKHARQQRAVGAHPNGIVGDCRVKAAGALFR